MATIPVQGTGLRHVRKTIAFDGTAGNGAVGTIPVFSCTGWVFGVYGFGYCTEDIVAGALTTLGLGIAGDSSWLGTAAGDDTSDARDLEAGDGFQGGYAGMDVVAGFFKTTVSPIGTDIFLTTNVQITDGTLVFEAWYLPASDDGALAGDDIDLELGAYLADKVLDEALSGHTTAGSLGKAVADVEVDTSTTLQGELDGIQADTEDIQSRLPAALVGGRIDANASAISGDTTAADRLEALMDGIIPGIVGASSTVTSVANCTGFTEATNDHFNGRLITFLTGNLAGQQCQITDYTGSSQTFTVTPLTEAPASSDTFVIH